MKISVILPAYNEEENVTRIVPELFPVLQKVAGDFEVIVVDDGSVDRTAEIIKNLHQPQIHLIKHGVNKGLGQALRTGVGAATGDYIVFMDSDFTFHPNLVPSLFQALWGETSLFPSRLNPHRNEETYADSVSKEVSPEPIFPVDFVIGSPALAEYAKDIPRWRVLISRFANGFYALLLGKPITSVNQIFRIYKSAPLKELYLESSGFEINAEILFKLVFAGRSFVEVPAPLTRRMYGVSKLNYWKETKRHFFLIFKILRWKFLGRKSTA